MKKMLNKHVSHLICDVEPELAAIRLVVVSHRYLMEPRFNYFPREIEILGHFNTLHTHKLVFAVFGFMLTMSHKHATHLTCDSKLAVAAIRLD